MRVLAVMADLEGLGGLGPLVGLLGGAPGLQAGSAAVLGTAASNNVKFQEQLIDAFPSVLGKLLEVRNGKCGCNVPGGGCVCVGGWVGSWQLL